MHIFEEGLFEVDELKRDAADSHNISSALGERVTVRGGRVECRAFPFVVMTSNSEREFPAPFLRRCIQLEMHRPDVTRLTEIVHRKLEVLDPKAFASHRDSIEEIINAFDQAGKERDLAVDQLLQVILLRMKDIDPFEGVKPLQLEQHRPLMRSLDEAGLDPEPDELADILWLAARILREGGAAERPADKSKRQSTHSEVPTQSPSQEKPLGESAPRLSSAAYEPPKPTPEASVTLHRHRPEEQADMGDEPLPASPFRTPGVTPLPNALALSRALRPLRRRIPSRRARVLDLEATVQQIADKDLWQPVTRPYPEPWLDLDLVVDDSKSMVVWRPQVHALHRLLLRQDAFGRLRLLHLRRDGDNLALFDARGRRVRAEPPVTNPMRRRLILLLSDCVATDWQGTHGVAEILRQRLRHTPVTLLQMLPQRLWSNSALGDMERVSLHAVTPAQLNSGLVSDRAYWSRDVAKLPVITLHAHALRTWAALIAGRSDLWCAGLAFSPRSLPEATAAAPAASPDDSAQRLAAFRDFASPEARDLARDLSVLPLNLPIMRLAQRVLSGKDGRLTQLAEVFLGGILQRVDHHLPVGQQETDPDHIPFDFVGTIRERLLQELPTDEVRRIDECMSRAVEQHLGQASDFFALIAQDGGNLRLPLNESTLPFARIRAKVLSRLGGGYLERALAITKRIKEIETSVSAQAADVLLISRDSETAEALRRAYRDRSKAQPEARAYNGLIYDDLGTINRSRVLHYPILENKDWDVVPVDMDQVLEQFTPVSVLEIGIAESSQPDHHSPGDLLIVKGVQDGDNHNHVAAQATPRLVEACLFAQSSWRGRPVHSGILWQSDADPGEWRMHYRDEASERRPGVVSKCAEHGVVWIALRGLIGFSGKAPLGESLSPEQAAAESIAYFLLHTLEQTPYVPTHFRDRLKSNLTGGPEMVWLPGGSFRMGSPEGIGRDNERPVHEVTLNHYGVAKHPVTVGEFRRFVEATGYQTEAEEGDGAWIWNQGSPEKKGDASWRKPYMDQGGDHPVVAVSWNDVQAYCKWLSKVTGRDYGLLTEAQWEFACRAGSETAYCFGDDPKALEKYAWYGDRSEKGSTHPVGKKTPNAWGLHDMYGNAWEWVHEWYSEDYHEQLASATPSSSSGTASGSEQAPSKNPSGPESGSNRVIRGGSWNNDADNCRSAYRNNRSPGNRNNNLGFRLSSTRHPPDGCRPRTPSLCTRHVQPRRARVSGRKAPSPRRPVASAKAVGAFPLHDALPALALAERTCWPYSHRQNTSSHGDMRYNRGGVGDARVVAHTADLVPPAERKTAF